ncbi:MAG: TatD family hydrolase [Promethearchaeota archaeon]
MTKKNLVPEPEEGLNFIDVHCHLPFTRPKKNDKLPSDEEQYYNYFNDGGVFLITSSIDMHTLKMILNFVKDKKNIGFSCGWAPQTVTYTPKNKYDQEWKEWITFINENPDRYLAIGEIGLDFHHARVLSKRNKQIEVFKKIFEKTEDLKKPYILHVRNAAEHEYDRDNPKHRFNKIDGANQEILNTLKEFNVEPKRVMWHCFSGPELYGMSLSKQGFLLSVPSSAYGNKRWRRVSTNASLDSLVTETDSYYQHPYLRGPVNVPSNAKYAVAAIAFSHNVTQTLVSEKTIENAIKFFNLNLI